MKKRKHVFWESILILGSVLIFRSLWLIMDSIPLLSDMRVLIVSFIIGMVAMGIGFYRMAHAH